jgi:predicted nuclease of predicted toxin-antitoxin system
VRFLIDAQLLPTLANWLRGLGHETDHVLDLGMLDAPDHAVWTTAASNGAIIVTKDRDFVEWAVARDPAPQVLWLRMGNIGNISLIARLEAVWSLIEESLASGVRIVEAGRP